MVKLVPISVNWLESTLLYLAFPREPFTKLTGAEPSIDRRVSCGKDPITGPQNSEPYSGQESAQLVLPAS